MPSHRISLTQGSIHESALVDSLFRGAVMDLGLRRYPWVLIEPIYHLLIPPEGPFRVRVDSQAYSNRGIVRAAVWGATDDWIQAERRGPVRDYEVEERMELLEGFTIHYEEVPEDSPNLVEEPPTEKQLQAHYLRVNVRKYLSEAQGVMNTIYTNDATESPLRRGDYEALECLDKARIKLQELLTLAAPEEEPRPTVWEHLDEEES